jgi:hypothetical protein
MPEQLVWVEDGDSRQATIVRKGRKATSSYQKSYKIFGTADDVVLHEAINAEITTNGAYWQYPGVESMQLRAESYSVSFLGDNAWQLTISYSKDGAEDGTDPLKRARSFDTTGGTQHITQAESEVGYPSGFGGANYQFMAIGVDANGVNGVDVVVPQLQWQEQYDVPNAYVTSDYIKSLASLTGTVNNAAFRGFAIGEVLFIGCSGSQEWDDQKGRGPWNLSYRFIASPNAGAGQTLPARSIGDITGIEKKGHEYLWVKYEESVSGAGNALLKKPKAVYVNKVYREGNFSSLGIGTT